LCRRSFSRIIFGISEKKIVGPASCSDLGEHHPASRYLGWPSTWASAYTADAAPRAVQRAAAFRRASVCAASAATCAFAKRSDALAWSEVFVASDWIRPNTTRWRSVVGVDHEQQLVMRNQLRACVRMVIDDSMASVKSKRARKRHVQQELFRRGGKRRGSGRKPKGARTGEQHDARPELKPHHALHVVMRVVPAVGSMRRRKLYKAMP
jgi:hypothetical protein